MTGSQRKADGGSQGAVMVVQWTPASELCNTGARPRPGCSLRGGVLVSGARSGTQGGRSRLLQAALGTLDFILSVG